MKELRDTYRKQWPVCDCVFGDCYYILPVSMNDEMPLHAFLLFHPTNASFNYHVRALGRGKPWAATAI